MRRTFVIAICLLLVGGCSVVRQPPAFNEWPSYLDRLLGKGYNEGKTLKRFVYVNSFQRTSPQHAILLWSANDDPNSSKFLIWIQQERGKDREVISTDVRFYERQNGRWTNLETRSLDRRELPLCDRGAVPLWERESVFHKKLSKFAEDVGSLEPIKIPTICAK